MTERKNKNDQNVDGKHIPIMVCESLEILALTSDDIVVDCTTNRGGHSIAFAKRIGGTGTLICIDLDSEALLEAKSNLESEVAQADRPTIHYVNDNFANLKNILHRLNIEKVNAIYADLGISSQELDISGRGFSFMRDEPLLMTFKSNPDAGDITARDIVNTWSKDNIADILYNFSDEVYSRQIAAGIASERKHREIETTFDLVKVIKKSVPHGYANGKSNCATKTFQALRMAVNREVDNLITLIKDSKEVLETGGRLAFLTFHSTEDRLVKVTAKEIGLAPINKKVIEANYIEVRNNPRSRSAKLRGYVIAEPKNKNKYEHKKEH